MKKYIALFVCTCFVCFLLAGDHSQAVNYDKKIKEAEQQQKEYAKKADRMEDNIDDIEEQQDDTLALIEKLDKKTEKLETAVADLEGRIKTTKVQLASARYELTEAQQAKEKQYTTMKKRIKYMYENGNQDYLEILFGAASITELLSRSEYVEKITAYDNEIFVEFEKTCATIKQKEQEIASSLEELEQMTAEKKAEQQEIDELTGQKKRELAKYNNQLEKSQEQLDEYNRKAIAAENAVEDLLKKKQAEIDSRQGDSSGGGGSGTMQWPISGGGGRISSNFGPRTSPTAGASSYHRGIDIAAASGTPIVAADSGTVVTATYSSSAGNYAMIAHGNRLYTVYMHCSRLAVSVGDKVSKGEVIAYVGSTGISTGPHLHFGVSKNGEYVNPLKYVSR